MHVRQTRGQTTETVHELRAVAFLDGEVCWATGPETRSPWRSAAKPLQLTCSIEAIQEARGDQVIDDRDLALGASSHSGQDFHVSRVRELLTRYGLVEEQLLCGAEAPAHRATMESLIRNGRDFQAIHNDCSGKHTFMLAACRAKSWPLEYLEPTHPLQERILEAARAWSSEQPALAVDGCGVPTLCLSIEGMARAWSRLATSMSRDDNSLIGRIGWAMANHPRLTSGDQRLDLAVVQGASEPMAVKIGANGVFCLALPRRRTGIAIKCLTGDEDALAVAIPAILELAAPGSWNPRTPWAWREVRNVVGRLVGRRVAEFNSGA